MTAPSVFPPDCAAKFRHVRRLSAGSFGEVHLAEHRALRRAAAVKLLQTDVDAALKPTERFVREARITSALSHPAIVIILDFGDAAGVPWIAYEFLAGPTMASAIRQGPHPVAAVLEAGVRLASALEYAHGEGVLHRDLKPANILSTPEGEWKLVDFGLARWTDSSMTAVGAVLGTPLYMAPELFRREPHTRSSDVYGLGATLFELATGQRLFPVTDLGELVKMKRKGPEHTARQLLPAIPAELSDLLQRMVAQRPEDRPAGMARVRAALESIRPGPALSASIYDASTVALVAPPPDEPADHSTPTVAGPAIPAPPAPRPIRRSVTASAGTRPRYPAAAAGVLLAALLLGALGALALRRDPHPPEPVVAGPAPRSYELVALESLASDDALLVRIERASGPEWRLELSGPEGPAGEARVPPGPVNHTHTFRGLAPATHYRLAVLTPDGRRIVARHPLQTQSTAACRRMDRIVAPGGVLGAEFQWEAISSDALTRGHLPPLARLAQLVKDGFPSGGHAQRRLVNLARRLGDHAMALELLRRGSASGPLNAKQMVMKMRLEGALEELPPEGVAGWAGRLAAAASRLPLGAEAARWLVDLDPDDARPIFRRWIETPGAGHLHEMGLCGLGLLGQDADSAALGRVAAGGGAAAVVAAEVLADLVLPSARQALTTALEASPASPSLLWRAAQAIPPGDPLAPRAAGVMLRTLASSEPRARAAAAGALGLTDGPGAEPALVRALEDPAPEVVECAAWALARRQAPTALPYLRAHAASGRDRSGTAAWALGVLRDPDAGPLLEKNLAHLVATRPPGSSVRLALTAWALRRLPNHRAAPALDRLVAARDTDRLVAQCAREPEPIPEGVVEWTTLPFIPADRIPIDLEAGAALACRARHTIDEPAASSRRPVTRPVVRIGWESVPCDSYWVRITAPRPSRVAVGYWDGASVDPPAEPPPFRGITTWWFSRADPLALNAREQP